MRCSWGTTFPAMLLINISTDVGGGTHSFSLHDRESSRCTSLNIETVSQWALSAQKYGFHMCSRKHEGEHTPKEALLTTSFHWLFRLVNKARIISTDHFLL